MTPALRALRATLDEGLNGPGTGAVVYDLSTHELLYDWRGVRKRPPASVEKLYTAAAVLQRLGPDATLQTEMLATGHLGPHGVWHGNLYLRGGGDPTLGDGAFNHRWGLGYGPTATQLAQQIQRAGIRRVTGFLYGDESLFDSSRGGLLTNLAPDLPDLGGELSALTYDHGQTVGSRSPAAFAARQLAATLFALHIHVKASQKTRPTPLGAERLGAVSSPPMQILLRLMDVPSDDLFAEMLTKQLGARFGTGGTIASGAQVIAQTVAAAYNVHPKVHDGSGLSRNDGTSPVQTVTLLRELWRTTLGNVLYASLPLVGINGTVANVAAKTAAVGRCSAKTGTLDGITNLAGYCHCRGHQALAFALMVDGPPNAAATASIGKMVAAIARY